MMAAGYGYDETVRLLLGHGANPRLRNRHGLTALDLALTDVGDIDEFTLGRCQTQTVKALLNRAPDLATAPTQRCTEIDVLIRNARYLSE